VFCFYPDGPDDLAGLLSGLDLAPFVGRVGTREIAIGEAELVWPPELPVASATALRDLDEAQRRQLAQGGSDGLAMDAIALDVVIGERQLAVVVAAVMRQLDLKPRHLDVF
jgi:hypothetical protein